jgi:hypothetical protein
MIHTKKETLLRQLQKIVKQRCDKQLLQGDRLIIHDIEVILEALEASEENYGLCVSSERESK